MRFSASPMCISIQVLFSWDCSVLFSVKKFRYSSKTGSLSFSKNLSSNQWKANQHNGPMENKPAQPQKLAQAKTKRQHWVLGYTEGAEWLSHAWRTPLDWPSTSDCWYSSKSCRFVFEIVEVRTTVRLARRIQLCIQAPPKLWCTARDWNPSVCRNAATPKSKLFAATITRTGIYDKIICEMNASSNVVSFTSVSISLTFSRSAQSGAHDCRASKQPWNVLTLATSASITKQRKADMIVLVLVNNRTTKGGGNMHDK